MKKGTAGNIVCDECRKTITHQQYIVISGKKRILHYCNNKRCLPADKRPAIVWIEQHKLFGLNYSSAQLQYTNSTIINGIIICDIRCDYDGSPNKKPNNPLWSLTLKKKNEPDMHIFSRSIKRLKTISETFCKTNCIIV